MLLPQKHEIYCYNKSLITFIVSGYKDFPIQRYKITLCHDINHMRNSQNYLLITFRSKPLIWDLGIKINMVTNHRPNIYINKVCSFNYLDSASRSRPRDRHDLQYLSYDTREHLIYLLFKRSVLHKCKHKFIKTHYPFYHE